MRIKSAIEQDKTNCLNNFNRTNLNAAYAAASAIGITESFSVITKKEDKMIKTQ